jgi:hypothetical protein
MNIKDLRQSILTLPPTDGLNLILEIRANRLIYKPPANRKPKANKSGEKAAASNGSTKPTRKGARAPKSTPGTQELLKLMSTDDKLELLKRLIGGDKKHGTDTGTDAGPDSGTSSGTSNETSDK